MNLDELAKRMIDSGNCLHGDWTTTLIDCLSDQLGCDFEHELDHIIEAEIKAMRRDGITIPEHLEAYAEEHECL